MKLHTDDINGKVVKEDDRYTVIDNTTLNNLILSSTNLHPNKSTTGHSHPGQEEVYYFIKGSGQMELDNETINVTAGDVVLIPDGVFHRVHNDQTVTDLYFLCVFDGSRKH